MIGCLQVLQSKLDEESQARIYAIRDMGKAAANLLCNPETTRPLDDPAPAPPADQGEPPDAARQNQGNGHHQDPEAAAAWGRVGAMEAYSRVDASALAGEAIARNAESAPIHASNGIADILMGPKGRQGVSGEAVQCFHHLPECHRGEALQGHKTVAGEGATPAFLRKAFSLCERDDAAVDLAHLNTPPEGKP